MSPDNNLYICFNPEKYCSIFHFKQSLKIDLVIFPPNQNLSYYPM